MRLLRSKSHALCTKGVMYRNGPLPGTERLESTRLAEARKKNLMLNLKLNFIAFTYYL